MRIRSLLFAAALVMSACQKAASPVQTLDTSKFKDKQDYHSYSNPLEVRVRHIDLDLDVRFSDKILRGSATLWLDRPQRDKPLVTDTRDLKISRVETSGNTEAWSPAQFTIGETDRTLGAPLTVQLPQDATRVRISYETAPEASGLQWLTPAQTAGKRHPFLFTQSQAIHARSWIPTQDSPGVRVTYKAKVRVPAGLRAVMSARNDPGQKAGSEFAFEMPQPIPAYLIALAVGDLQYQAISPRTGVWTEPSMLARSAAEFADTEKMVEAAEKLYGKYRWDQYDVLILPPSFPFGGMENPRLTFATPTIITGDKSLVGLIAHELAHSWSGNLVTNATWRDFWLNEGFTVYFERRIQEEVYGRARSDMEALIEKQELVKEISELPEKDQILYVDLKGRDPDEGFTQVPYVKGMLFLRRLEEVFGRERFDAFLQSYFNQFAFKSIVTGDFLDYLQEHLLSADAELAAQVNVDEWMTQPGLPKDAPNPTSDALALTETAARNWSQDEAPAASLPGRSWSTQEWLHFLRSLPPQVDPGRLAELDKTFSLTNSQNSEILADWLLLAVRNGYAPAYPKLERFLIGVGRRKYIRPLYLELAKSEKGKAMAKAMYAKARAGYHPIAVASIDEILK